MASQFTMVSPGRVLVNAGAIVSMITKSAVVVDAFPQLSAAENVTDVADTVGQVPGVGVAVAESSLQKMEPDAVEAEAPPRAAIHAWNSEVLPAPSQFTVSFAAGVPITGGVVLVSLPEGICSGRIATGICCGKGHRGGIASASFAHRVGVGNGNAVVTVV